MLRQKANPRQRVRNVDIGIQQLRYWLPAGAELSVAATALFASFAHPHHCPAKCSKMHKEHRSGLPLVAHCLPQEVGCG